MRTAFWSSIFDSISQARVRWLTIAVRFHSITRTHAQTHAYISITKVCKPVEWSQCEVGERGRRYICTCEHTICGTQGAVQGQILTVCLLLTQKCTRIVHKHVNQIKLKAIPPACCCLTLFVTWEKRQGEQWRGAERSYSIKLSLTPL